MGDFRFGCSFNVCVCIVWVWGEDLRVWHVSKVTDWVKEQAISNESGDGLRVVERLKRGKARERYVLTVGVSLGSGDGDAGWAAPSTRKKR